jgi:hypothetical protein
MPDHYDPQRDDDNRKGWLHGDFKYMGTNAQRIANAQYWNQMCDSIPTDLHKSGAPENLMKLRNRQPEKELYGQFRFKPKTRIERLFDTLSKRDISGRSPDQLLQEC